MMHGTLRRHKHPIEYELKPRDIDVGPNWVTLTLKNISDKPLRHLDVQLHSLDTYNLWVYGTGLYGAGHYLQELGFEEEDSTARL